MRLRKRAFHGYERLRRRLLGIPSPGALNFGDLRRVEPVSRHFGTDRGLPVGERGLPVDRHYIERFLTRHAHDVHGAVLEVGDDAYTRRFGGAGVTHSDVLHIRDGNPAATIVADLADAPQIPDASFDCVILTQTLHLIYDVRAAIATLHRILRPQGVLLLTAPGITQVPVRTTWGHTWYWSFTALSVQRMLAEVFGARGVTVDSDGNILSVTAFLHGLAAQELVAEELEFCDPDYPLIIAARAIRAVDS